MPKLTITIYRNSLKPKEGKQVAIHKISSIPALLDICSTKLG